MQHFLDRISHFSEFTRQEASTIMELLLQESTDPIQSGAFLCAMNVKGITATEMRGFIDTLRAHAHRPEGLPNEVLDVCGTGGDGKNTFNISTLSGIVLATAGIPVVKHGNAAVSSHCGSSDVLSKLGMHFSNNSAVLRAQLDASHFCYLHAPFFHPALKTVAPVRKRLKIKTFFNQLGPLVNPAAPSMQLTGVFNMPTLRLYGDILPHMLKRFGVVYSMDGYDEISLTGPFKMLTQDGEYLYEPHDFGLKPLSPDDLSGGHSAEQAVDIFISVLNGTAKKEHLQVVAINAGAALHIARPGTSIKDGFEEALALLKSGKCINTLNRAIHASKNGRNEYVHTEKYN